MEQKQQPTPAVGDRHEHDTAAEQYARRVLREVVYEGGASDKEGAPNAPARGVAEPNSSPAAGGLTSLHRIFSGTILLSRQARRNYPYLLTIAAMFFLNIVVLFWSLHLDARFMRLEREVQKLRERSIRLEEQRFQLGSHSRVVEELARRGIAIQDPVRPAEKIE